MKLLAAISHHGLGHLAQAAPVLNTLRNLHPALELTLWSGLHSDALHARIEGHFEHRHEAADIGLVMHDAMRVDLRASHSAYQGFHADWPTRVKHEADWLQAQGFDQVFADAAYLPLAAAAQAGIDGVALCSLNWTDITRSYLTGLPGMDAIFNDMAVAYDAARVFLQPAPSMPMPQLARRLGIAPISALGRKRRQALIDRFALPVTQKLALLGFGGIGYQGNSALPAMNNVTWLAPDDWQFGRVDVIPFSALAMPFLDMLASSDVLITKVGYGSFVEAAAHQVPVLYLDRPDWPETPYLTRWLAEHGSASALNEQSLFSAQLEKTLTELWQKPIKPAVRAEGAEQAARQLMARGT